MSKCPFLKEECIKEECAVWVKGAEITITQGSIQKSIPFEPMCSIAASGLSAVLRRKKEEGWFEQARFLK